MNEKVLSETKFEGSAAPSNVSRNDNLPEAGTAQIKERVLANIISRIEAREAQVDMGSTTLHGFAQFGRC